MDDYLYKIFDAIVAGISLFILYSIVDFLCSLYDRKKDK
ncbi:hypothetical protein P003_02989 [Enterococcus faecalis EnGen0403]|nr:hypothetical protein P003_02989 [Enterococcus faecalis EnGen0403]ETU00514.1 hypothetical protein P004_03016 [Enterococcus faecalis EnGen0404]ETU01048.1 hypothetical protein P005_02987 [Enterococcus faecalis EnGen0405]ETU11974.1 hypothetical protein P008_03077 [Enterococcus faecalis EnGen0408]